MSTLDRPPRTPGAPPPLVAGQRLDRATFHARYEAMPPGTRAELIGGIVVMPSPASWNHGAVLARVVFWLLSYQRATPGVEGADNASVFLDDRGEPQPDALLRLPEDRGGRSRIEGGFIVGAPELVVEVSRSTRPVDLGPKLEDYRRAGVREYLVVALGPDEVFWHVLRDGRYERLAPGPDGLIRSEVFPGLWLDPPALLAGDLGRLAAALDRGVATPEHAAFVAALTDRTGP